MPSAALILKPTSAPATRIPLDRLPGEAGAVLGQHRFGGTSAGLSLKFCGEDGTEHPELRTIFATADNLN